MLLLLLLLKQSFNRKVCVRADPSRPGVQTKAEPSDPSKVTVPSGFHRPVPRRYRSGVDQSGWRCSPPWCRVRPPPGCLWVRPVCFRHILPAFDYLLLGITCVCFAAKFALMSPLNLRSARVSVKKKAYIRVKMNPWGADPVTNPQRKNWKKQNSEKMQLITHAEVISR